MASPAPSSPASTGAAYPFKAVEAEVREFWQREGIETKARETSRASPKKFYFVDGPPYTSGHVHIGTAWNKSLKDSLIRYKRMRGYDVWDRAGYDMHGLPTEKATEKALGLEGKEGIERFGRERFVEECKRTCVRNLEAMTREFRRMGVWMDFDHAYQTVAPEWIDGVWWWVKKVAEQGRLYEAEKTMMWDAVNSTALAKHETDYKSVEDNSIFVRLRLCEAAKEAPELPAYFVVWTTTPWTIPYNLAVMLNPTVDYVRVVVRNFKGEPRQVWTLAHARVQPFLGEVLHMTEGTDFEVVWMGKGSDLAGVAYVHPFARHSDVYATLKAQSPRVHTALLSAQFVDTESGTGIVHCAPGCGPEDYVVGKENGIDPFNTVDEGGVARVLPPVTGLRAKIDDPTFVRLIGEEGALVCQQPYTHDYPMGERSKQPVIFRTTKQWFVRVEDIKDKMLAANEGVNWVPVAAKNAFRGWLTNLRDNSISKQRYWGTPLPIWRCKDDPDKWVVVGSADELCDRAGLPRGSLTDLHPPVVDRIEFTVDGKVYHRVPDVMDVWVDAGAAARNCMKMPQVPGARPSGDFEQWYPAEFIMEGRDQIRGWFNLLHLESMVALDRPAFRNVYMHGFILARDGRKMSKSLGNYISPAEVFESYGVDAMRYYVTGAAQPGCDLRYDADDGKAVLNTLGIFWSVHNYVLVTAQALSEAAEAAKPRAGELGLGERYILSRLYKTVAQVTELFDQYRLNEVPKAIEAFFLEVSHVYIQLIWEKKDTGSLEEKVGLVSTLAECLSVACTLLSTVCPFLAEKMYRNLRAAMPAFCAAPSVHLQRWPEVDKTALNSQVEDDVNAAKDAITAVLAARDKASLAVKQPCREVRVECPPRLVPLLEHSREMVLARVNAKALVFGAPQVTVSVAVNEKTVGKQFGRNRARITQYVNAHSAEIAKAVMSRPAGDHWAERVEIDGTAFDLKEEHLLVTRGVASNWAQGASGEISAFLDVTRTEELEMEGRIRELARKIQALRKVVGLNRGDMAKVDIVVPSDATTVAEAVRASLAYLRDRTSSEIAVSSELTPSEASRPSALKCTVEKLGRTSVLVAISR